MGADKKFEGKNKAASKLTVTNVRDIREMYARGDATQGQLSREYKVSIVTIGRIVRFESWQDVPAREVDPLTLQLSAERLLRMQESVDNPRALGDELLKELDSDKGDTLE